jgi:membrane-associated phospholipid phosphatase
MLEMYAKVYKKPLVLLSLRAIDYIAIGYSVAALGLLSWKLFHSDPLLALRLLLSLLISFIAVSVFRRAFNAPRPYELYDFSSVGLTPPRAKTGRSFPSRHVHSSAVIATALFLINPFMGSVGVILASLLAVSRVLRGIHFVRDVVTGMLTGIFSGVISILLLYI